MKTNLRFRAYAQIIADKAPIVRKSASAHLGVSLYFQKF